MMEKLEVYVDGVNVTGLDRPVVSSAIDTGAVTEDTNVQSSALKSIGTIQFFDLDLSDSHDVSVLPAAGVLGGLTAGVSNSATGDGQGTVTWTYSVANGAVQYLAAGQTRIETFTVRIVDHDNVTSYVDTSVTVTITGTNDVPTITATATDALGPSRRTQRRRCSRRPA